MRNTFHFAANLTMLFKECKFEDRFAAASKLGFQYVEFLFPYDYKKELLKELLRENNLKQVLFNAPPGNFEQGDRGTACLKNRMNEFQEGVHLAVEYASFLDVSRVHVMSGLNSNKNDKAAFELYCENILWASDVFKLNNIELLIEPINNFDIPNYLLNDFDVAWEFISSAAKSNLRLQFDIYHAQRMGLDIKKYIKNMFSYISHFQLANTPGRHEPIDGEINYTEIWSLLTQLGYTGFVGCEYNPKTTTIEGLKRWFTATL